MKRVVLAILILLSGINLASAQQTVNTLGAGLTASNPTSPGCIPGQADATCLHPFVTTGNTCISPNVWYEGACETPAQMCVINGGTMNSSGTQCQRCIYPNSVVNNICYTPTELCQLNGGYKLASDNYTCVYCPAPNISSGWGDCHSPAVSWTCSAMGGTWSGNDCVSCTNPTEWTCSGLGGSVSGNTCQTCVDTYSYSCGKYYMCTMTSCFIDNGYNPPICYSQFHGQRQNQGPPNQTITSTTCSTLATCDGTMSGDTCLAPQVCSTLSTCALPNMVVNGTCQAVSSGLSWVSVATGTAGNGGGSWDSFMNRYAIFVSSLKYGWYQGYTSYSTNFSVPQDGNYTLTQAADNEAYAYIDDNLINHQSTFTSESNTTVYLSSGAHTIMVNVYNYYGGGFNPGGWAATISDSSGTVIWDTLSSLSN